MRTARAVPNPLKRGTHRSLRAAAYEALRERLMNGRLAPGMPISLVEVPREFGVGHSAVREALCQLAADGMVIAEDQRGFIAAPISNADLVDLTVARVDIESFALRDAIARGDLQWEARILAEFEKLSAMRRTEGENPRPISSPYAAQHLAFHDALVAACSSQWMLRFRRTLHHHSERYRQLAVSYNDEKRPAAAEHRAIMEAALARNADLAVSLMTEHVNETARTLLRIGITDSAPRGSSAH